MNSSGKFFVPMMIVGPVVDVACAGRVNAAANKPMTIATPRQIANAAFAARPGVLADHCCSFRERSPMTLVRRRPLGVTAICSPSEGEEHDGRERHHAERRAEHARRAGSSPG